MIDCPAGTVPFESPAGQLFCFRTHFDASESVFMVSYNTRAAAFSSRVITRTPRVSRLGAFLFSPVNHKIPGYHQRTVISENFVRKLY